MCTICIFLASNASLTSLEFTSLSLEMTQIISNALPCDMNAWHYHLMIKVHFDPSICFMSPTYDPIFRNLTFYEPAITNLFELSSVFKDKSWIYEDISLTLEDFTRKITLDANCTKKALLVPLVQKWSLGNKFFFYLHRIGVSILQREHHVKKKCKGIKRWYQHSTLPMLKTSTSSTEQVLISISCSPSQS